MQKKTYLAFMEGDSSISYKDLQQESKQDDNSFFF